MKDLFALKDMVFHEGYLNKDGYGEYSVTATALINRQEEVFFQRRDQVEWNPDQHNLRVLNSTHFYDGTEEQYGLRNPDCWERSIPAGVAPDQYQAWREVEQFYIDQVFAKDIPVWSEVRSHSRSLYLTKEDMAEGIVAETSLQRQVSYYLDHEDQTIELGKLVSYVDPNRNSEYHEHTVHNPQISNMLVIRDAEEVKALAAQHTKSAFALEVEGPLVMLHTIDSQRQTDLLLLSTEKGLEPVWIRERNLENQVINESLLATSPDRTRQTQHNSDISL